MIVARLAVVVAACACLTACAADGLGVEPARVGSAPDLADVQALLDELVRADNAGDAARVAGLYTDDAVWLPWAGPAVVGREAIEASYAEVFAAVDLTLSLAAQEIAVDGAGGHVLGTTHVSMAPRAGGAPLLRDDKFLMVVRRTERGWRIARLAWSPVEGAAP